MVILRIYHCVGRGNYAFFIFRLKFEKSSLNNRIKINGLSLLLNSGALDEKISHIGLARVVVVVGFVIVAAKTLVLQGITFPAAFWIIVDRQVYQRCILICELMIDAIVSETSIFIDA